MTQGRSLKKIINECICCGNRILSCKISTGSDADFMTACSISCGLCMFKMEPNNSKFHEATGIYFIFPDITHTIQNVSRLVGFMTFAMIFK